MNQGVIAFARIPDQRPLQEVVNQERFCVVALNGIDHAVNVGSILRNCAAFNVSAVILDAVTVHPYCWRSVQASVGGVFQVPFYVASDLALLLKRIRGEGAMLVAADPSGGMVLADLKIPEKVCLILGNEHRGISTNILSLRPERTVIPIEKVDSLNVAAASAIFLHEISLRWNV
jgi:tRNA G18 (ribose-2'-O)-methylase SpoU